MCIAQWCHRRELSFDEAQIPAGVGPLDFEWGTHFQLAQYDELKRRVGHIQRMSRRPASHGPLRCATASPL